MEYDDYELLKIETKIDRLEKELSILFNDFKLINKDRSGDTVTMAKLKKMNFCCLNLLDTYREYTKKLKNGRR